MSITNESVKKKIDELVTSIVNYFNDSNFDIIIRRLSEIPAIYKMNCDSAEHQRLQALNPKHFNPAHTFRGEIHNAILTDSVGSELSGNHLVIIMQNKKGNIFGNKVSVLPIEGDGTIVDPNYQEQIGNDDLEWGHLNKNPSRIIMTDIMTIDKARLDMRVGKIKPEKMIRISDKLKFQLEL